MPFGRQEINTSSPRVLDFALSGKMQMRIRLGDLGLINRDAIVFLIYWLCEDILLSPRCCVEKNRKAITSLKWRHWREEARQSVLTSFRKERIWFGNIVHGSLTK